MAEGITIGCFLEDIGQERFILALIRRIAADAGQMPDNCHFDIRNAQGGSSRVLTEYARFVRDYAAGRTLSPDVLVVAIDGNSRGPTAVISQLNGIKERHAYAGRVVYAVPDPHIERWYMVDSKVCQAVLGTAQPLHSPADKRGKGDYKKALVDAIKSTGVVPLQGGAEYAPEIAEQMDIHEAGKNDPSLGRFIEEMRNALRSLQP